MYTVSATGGSPSFLAPGINPDGQPLPAPTRPESNSECKDGGHEEFGFKTQGQCIASVQTAAKVK
jgi:hypothetical protein